MGALTEHHRCPRGPFHRLVEAQAEQIKERYAKYFGV